MERERGGGKREKQKENNVLAGIGCQDTISELIRIIGIQSGLIGIWVDSCPDCGDPG